MRLYLLSNSYVLKIFKAMQISVSINDMFNEIPTNVILSLSLISIEKDYSRIITKWYNLVILQKYKIDNVWDKYTV